MMQWTCPKCRSRFPTFLVGDVLRHIPTGRPVRVVEITLDSFTVDTTDDIWIHADAGGYVSGRLANLKCYLNW
jgi:hypothetical protein